MTKRIKLICGSLFFALMLVSLWTSFYADWLEKTRSSRRGWEAMEIKGKPVIYRVDADVQAPEVKVGDEIISLKGQSPGAFPVMYQDRCDVVAGSDYILVIRRSGKTQELTLKTIPFPLSKRVSNWALNLILLSFLVAALTVFLLKPHDRQAWLLALMLGTFTGLFEGFAFGLSGWMLGAAMAASIAGLAFLPIFFHFFLIFPEHGIERGPLLRRFPRLEYLLYLPFLLTILPYSGLQRAGDYLNIEGLVSWLPAKNLLRGGSMIFVVSYLVGCLVAMVGNYRAANANARRKLRFVVAGCSAGVLNLLLIVLGEFIGIQRTRPQFNDWL